MRIEKARSEDTHGILLVINEANREAFGRIIPKEHFKQPILTREEFEECSRKMTFYAYRHEKVVAATAALSVEGEDTGRIRWVYVLPEYQRQGIGTALVLHLERQAWEVGLRRARLVTDNGATWAIAFYEHLGYTLARRVPNPWGFDVWMEKQL
jgi:GNAT superfamily N-acetyltransferase